MSATRHGARAGDRNACSRLGASNVAAAMPTGDPARSVISGAYVTPQATQHNIRGNGHARCTAGGCLGRAGALPVEVGEGPRGLINWRSLEMSRRTVVPPNSHGLPDLAVDTVFTPHSCGFDRASGGASGGRPVNGTRSATPVVQVIVPGTRDVPGLGTVDVPVTCNPHRSCACPERLSRWSQPQPSVAYCCMG